MLYCLCQSVLPFSIEGTACLVPRSDRFFDSFSAPLSPSRSVVSHVRRSRCRRPILRSSRAPPRSSATVKRSLRSSTCRSCRVIVCGRPPDASRSISPTGRRSRSPRTLKSRRSRPRGSAWSRARSITFNDPPRPLWKPPPRRICRRIFGSTAARSIGTARGRTLRRTVTCGIRQSRRIGAPTTTAHGRQCPRTAGRGLVWIPGLGRRITMAAGGTGVTRGSGSPGAPGAARGRCRTWCRA